MKLLRAFRKAVIAGCLVGLAHFASAGVISFDPTPAFGNVGDPILVDIVWTGGPGEYIGDFDFDILWDDSIALITFLTFDPDFGVDSFAGPDCDTLGICGIGGAQGALNLFMVSLDSAPDLVANQDSLGNTFRLGILEYEGLADGLTDLVIRANAIGDEAGLPIDPQLIPGQICVGPAGCGQPVPEPAPLMLLALGLGMMVIKRITKRSA